MITPLNNKNPQTKPISTPLSHRQPEQTRANNHDIITHHKILPSTNSLTQTALPGRGRVIPGPAGLSHRDFREPPFTAAFPFTAGFLGLEPAGTMPKVRIHAWGPTTSSSCLR